jgi:AraC family transcriptional regulator
MPNAAYTVIASIAIDGMCAEVRDYAYGSPFEGKMERTSHTLSLGLSPRAAYSECRFENSSGEMHAWIDVGDVIFAPAGVVTYGRGSGGNFRRFVCSYEPAAFSKITGHGNTWSDAEIEAGLNVQSPAIKRDLYRLASEVSEREPGSDVITQSLSKLIAVEFVRYLHQRQQPQHSAQGKLAAWQLRRITDYVESMIEPTPSVERLAQLCEISSRHLRRAFRESTGTAISDYVKETRLLKAKSLLVDTDLALKEIAFRLGFSSPTSFGVAFAKATGLTPKHYRDRHK